MNLARLYLAHYLLAFSGLSLLLLWLGCGVLREVLLVGTIALLIALLLTHVAEWVLRKDP